jgi:hypothetical protein
MNGICQTCGTIAPIEWFLSETEHRQICAILVELPKDVQALVFHYLSLFRPVTGRAIQAKKATRLMTEIKQMVAAGHVQVDRKVARPCPPRVWAQAIERMIGQRDRLNLPMPNHNYLQKIAYDLADQADYQAEKKQYNSAQLHRRPDPVPDRSVADPALDPMEKARREWDAKHGAPSANLDLNSLGKLIKGMD